jgi:hypothetical protein
MEETLATNEDGGATIGTCPSCPPFRLKNQDYLSGDKEGARNAYKDFLALSKGADPDIPVLKQAKAEFEPCPSKLLPKTATPLKFTKPKQKQKR